MKERKGSKPQGKKLYSQKNKSSWSKQDYEILTAFFTVLLEIDQQTTVTKEYQNETPGK